MAGLLPDLVGTTPLRLHHRHRQAPAEPNGRVPSPFPYSLKAPWVGVKRHESPIEAVRPVRTVVDRPAGAPLSINPATVPICATLPDRSVYDQGRVVAGIDH